METKCYICQKPKAACVCGLCEESVCKKCAKFLEVDAFAFMPEDQVSPALKHAAYCDPCFHARVEPALDAYGKILAQAENVTVYLKNQGKEARLIRRAQFPIEVEGSNDHDETLMRLAFLAAKDGFNGLVSVEIKAAKVRTDFYQTSNFKGTGFPAQVGENKNKSTRPPRRSPSR